jgi:hypothetical protein
VRDAKLVMSSNLKLGAGRDFGARLHGDDVDVTGRATTDAPCPSGFLHRGKCQHEPRRRAARRIRVEASTQQVTPSTVRWR